tara:strand:+ start:56617 stop:57852 length:1236 start_codon:yes stop_codon:yes gene_type:complete
MLQYDSQPLIAIALVAVTFFWCSAEAEDVGSQNQIEAALKASKPLLDLRLRHETADEDGFAEAAETLTYRVRAGLETGTAFDTSFLIEFEHVDDLIDDYNSTINGKSGFPVVPDPQSTELNRFQITNTSLPGTRTTLGRQRIVLDDSRFVGNVGFRQNEQTLDAVRFQNTSFGKLLFDATYFNQVNRIFGDDSPVGRWHGDSYLLNVSHPTPLGKLNAFAYLIDVDESVGMNASQTFGARLKGEKVLTVGKITYAASLARQADYGSSDFEYSAEYYAAEGKYVSEYFNFGLGIESLGGDAQRGFQTPLATLHKFQGWADKFLSTPATGVEDVYAQAGYSPGNVGALSGVKLLAVYHDFSAETGGGHYGDEVDLLATAKWRDVNLSVKYANYNADEFASDTRKVWFEVEYAF